MYGSLEGAKTKEGATGLQKLRRSNFSYCKQVQEKMEWAEKQATIYCTH